MNDTLLKIFEDGLFAAIAAIGFSAINSTPRRAYAAIGVIAALSHGLRYALMAPWGAAMGLAGADTFAALCAGLCAIPVAPRIKCPAEVCFAPALLPMIPGMVVAATMPVFLFKRIAFRATR